MKKRLFSLMLTLAVMLTLVPTAFAARVEPLYGDHYNWGVMDGKRVLLDNYGPTCEDFTLTTDYGQHLRLVNREGDVEVDEIWCEVDGEKSDLLYMEEMDWGGFSTWWFQAGEEMEGELCALSDGTEYRMPFRVVSADSIFYDEKGSMWTPPAVTADTSDAASMRGYETYGLPGTEKTVELRFSDSAWAELETVELSRSNETSGDETVGDVLIARRVNGVLQLTGKSLSGVKLSVDTSSRAITMEMTVPDRAVKYGVALYGYRANREFDLIPGEDPAQAKEPEVPTVSAEPADPGLANFKAVNTYTQGQFADVAESFWGAANVARAYELGLMKGTSAAYFSPEESVTIAETITMAARLHSIYATGSENFVQSNIWYQTYVDYCKEKGIVTKDFDYNAPAKRSDFAAILAAALPAAALSGINDIGEIPDVAKSEAYAGAVYTLYRAGVLTGNDAAGTFGPETSINRAAAAAILTRMADPALRKNITL